MGLASARALAAQGFAVAILGRRRDALDRAVEALRAAGAGSAIGVQADATDAGQIEAAFAVVEERFGHVNALVNAVGPTVVGSFESLTDDDWHRAFDEGALTAVRTIRCALPLLRRSEWARIVNLTAMSTQHQTTSLIAYTASKAALASLTKNLARTLAADGILVNAVAPGSVISERIAGAVGAGGGDPSNLSECYEFLAERFGASIDLGRVALPEEVAAVVVFCASRENTFMTGAHINVDGGSDFT
jgi:NAD(P)-dependent dehydrogenase (short-subunit alcohol dehydrogenase family)